MVVTDRFHCTASCENCCSINLIIEVVVTDRFHCTASCENCCSINLIIEVVVTDRFHCTASYENCCNLIQISFDDRVNADRDFVINRYPCSYRRYAINRYTADYNVMYDFTGSCWFWRHSKWLTRCQVIAVRMQPSVRLTPHNIVNEMHGYVYHIKWEYDLTNEH